MTSSAVYLERQQRCRTFQIVVLFYYQFTAFEIAAARKYLGRQANHIRQLLCHGGEQNLNCLPDSSELIPVRLTFTFKRRHSLLCKNIKKN